MAAERLGAKTGECLVFEDATAGIEAGLNAGSDVIAIAHASPQDEKPACPVISDFREIEFGLS